MLDELIDASLFQEPEGYYPLPPEPKFYEHQRKPQHCHGPLSLCLRVVGKHSLWAHYVWNAGRVMADYLDLHPELSRGKSVLELGAGAALPSLVAAFNGAKHVVITDYPDDSLIENIEFNVKRNVIENDMLVRLHPMGFLWGSCPEKLLLFLQDECTTKTTGISADQMIDFPHTFTNEIKTVKFDIIILSDLLFNHSEHHAMLKTCRECLAPSGQVIVTYSSHRPLLVDKDRAFFTLAEAEYNFDVHHVGDSRLPPMFPEDVGDVDVRSTVHMYILTYHSTFDS